MNELLLPVRGQIDYRAGDSARVQSALSKINANLQKPLSPGDVVIFSAIMATAQLTTYATRLSASSLQNFAQDAAAGVAYLREHRTWDGVFGYTFGGRYDEATKQAAADIYIVKTAPDPEVALKRQQEAADIETGMRRDVSVGFGGPELFFRCDLCGNNMFSGDCPHLLGRTVKGVLQTATVENARLYEVSGVYKGACPGAVIDKAQEMYAARAFSAKEFRGWLDQMEVADPTRYLSTPPTTQSPSATTTEQGKKETKPMREKFASALMKCGLTVLALAVLGVKEDDAEGMAKELSAKVGEEVQSQLSANPLLKQLSAAGISTEKELETALKSVKDGQTYAASVQDTLEKEAIRNFGAEKGKEFAEAYSHLPIEQREKTAQSWKAEADKTFGVVQPTGQRTSVGTVALAATAETGTGTGNKWNALTDAQREFATKSLGIKDDAKREAYAASVLSQESH